MPYPRDSRAIVTRPINLASSRKRLQLLSPFPILCRIWTRLAREVGRFERFVFLFLAFVYKAFFFCFFWGGGTVIFGVFRLIDSCREPESYVSFFY